MSGSLISFYLPGPFFPNTSTKPNQTFDKVLPSDGDDKDVGSLTVLLEMLRLGVANGDGRMMPHEECSRWRTDDLGPAQHYDMFARDVVGVTFS